MLKSSAALAGVMAAGRWVSAESKAMNHETSDFYDDGVFNKTKAFEAYYEMMRRFHYPIPPVLKTDEFWTSDFAQSDFLRVGMAGVFWINNTEYGYFGHEIYLLPGQMIAEHQHNDCDDGPAKMESWQVRHGMVYTFGEGEPTKDLPIELPQSQLKVNGITALRCQCLKAGEVGTLNRVKAPHFMIAGPEGAIVTEYGTPHYGEALEFTNKSVKF
jgi:D-lyxose ketol-isomerase